RSDGERAPACLSRRRAGGAGWRAGRARLHPRGFDGSAKGQAGKPITEPIRVGLAGSLFVPAVLPSTIRGIVKPGGARVPRGGRVMMSFVKRLGRIGVSEDLPAREARHIVFQ